MYGIYGLPFTINKNPIHVVASIYHENIRIRHGYRKVTFVTYMVVIFSLTDDLYMESEVTNRATTGKDGSETHHFGMVLTFIYGYIRYIMGMVGMD